MERARRESGLFDQPPGVLVMVMGWPTGINEQVVTQWPGVVHPADVRKVLADYNSSAVPTCWHLVNGQRVPVFPEPCRCLKQHVLPGGDLDSGAIDIKGGGFRAGFGVRHFSYLPLTDCLLY
jgi:hypothetical protein